MPQPSLLQIKASAGSGKTFELTGIFLDLLAKANPEDLADACRMRNTLDVPAGYAWSEIMAATFTNRAAAEMKERVILRLKEMALGLCPLPAAWTQARARQWVGRILRHLSHLNIRTIDSLLNQLVRLAALELHIPPDFTPAFSTDEIFAPLMDDFLERARQNNDTRLMNLLEQACTTLVLEVQRTGFGAGTRLRKEIAPYLEYTLTHDCPEFTSRETLFTRRTALLAAVRESACALAEADLLFHKNFQNLLTRCAQVPAVPVPESAYWAKESLFECVTKTGHKAISKGAELAFANFIKTGTMVKQESALIQQALNSFAFTSIATELLTGLQELQYQQKSVPAQRIPFYAQRILNTLGASNAFCRLGSRLNHILIDEFQDTSQEQWGALHPLIVEALSKGGSLTWVGDVKQAIYGWRGGDAALFDDIAADGDMNAIAGDATLRRLPYNWRSCPEIINFNNSIFDALSNAEHAAGLLSVMLPPEIPPIVLADSAVRLSHTFEGAAQKVPAKKYSAGGYVHMQKLYAEKEGELQDLVKERLHALLDTLLTRKKYADITILVRSNADASRHAQWLVEWNIPVVTENSLLLAEHPLIAQLIAFLRFLVQPDDDAAFWDFLSGTRLFLPLTTLDYQELDSFCVQKRNKNLFTHFQTQYPQLWQQWIQPFYRMAGLMTAYDTLREAIRHFQIRERFPADEPFVQRLLECAFLAEKNSASTLSAFLDVWDTTANNEKVPMPPHLDAVQVLTIHKAKGLEFPVVILPTHHGIIRAHQSPRLYQSHDLTFLGTLCKEMGEPYYEQLAHDACENMHLLYVGWTRAVEELYCFLTSTKKTAHTGMAAAIDHILPETCFDDAGLLEWGTPSMSCSQQTACAATEPLLAPLLCPFAQPVLPMSWLPRLKIFRSNFESLGFGPNKRGTLAHSCLEALVLSRKQDPYTAVQHAVKYAFTHFPLPIPDERAMQQEMENMLLWYTSLPDATLWQEKGIPEQDIFDAQGAHLRADRIIFDNGSYTVLDYKTGAREKKHEKQMSAYLHALAEISQHPARGILVYLDQQELVKIAE